MDTTAFGRRIRERRDQLNYTQNELAERVGRAGWPIDPSTLSKLERGRASENPPFDLIRALTAALDTSLDWLVDGDSPSVLLAFERFRAVPSLQKSFTAMSAWYATTTSEAERRSFERQMERFADELTRPKQAPPSMRGESDDESGDDVDEDLAVEQALRSILS